MKPGGAPRRAANLRSGASFSSRLAKGTGKAGSRADAASITSMAETTQTVEERLQGIGTQLAWVREYL
jgi:hypothetical protein